MPLLEDGNPYFYLDGDAFNENKEPFKKMIAKWQELFTRDDFLNDIFLVKDLEGDLSGKLTNGSEFHFFYDPVTYLDYSNGLEYNFDSFSFSYETKDKKVFQFEFRIKPPEKGTIYLKFLSLHNRMTAQVDIHFYEYSHQENDEDQPHDIEPITTQMIFDELELTEFGKVLTDFNSRLQALLQEYEKEWFESACEELDSL